MQLLFEHVENIFDWFEVHSIHANHICIFRTENWFDMLKYRATNYLLHNWHRIPATCKLLFNGVKVYGIRQLLCDVLRDLLPFVQFKKLKKAPWRSFTFSKVANFSLQIY